MQKITRKKIIAMSVVIILIILVFQLIKGCGKSGGNVYEYQEATIGSVRKTISVTGILEVIDSCRVLCKAVGIIDRVHADYNHHVKKGQILATIKSYDIDQKMLKMGTQLESAKLELLEAKRNLEGQKNMFKDNLISKKGMQLAEIKYKKALLKHKLILIDYKNIKKLKSNTRILSPISGMILSKNIEENIPVVISQLLFVIAPSLKDMRLTISIDESEIGLVKKGQKVYFTVSAFPEKSFYGSISQVRINPIIKGGLVTYQSIVICENNELLLKPGMTATATIEVGNKKDVLRIPNQAFMVMPVETKFETNEESVWRKSSKLIGNLPVERVVVNTGLQGDKFTEITKNLKKVIEY